MTSTLAKDNLKLLESGDFADVEIICQTHVWKVHQAILAARSPWFKTALCGIWKEAETRQIRVDTMDRDVMSMVIKYVYSGVDKYESYQEVPTPPAKAKDASLHSLVVVIEDYVKLFIHADYFLLTQLKEDILESIVVEFCDSATRLCTFVSPKDDTNPAHCPAGYPLVSVPKERHPKPMAEFYRAVKLAYSIPTARKLHKTITAFVLLMHGRIHVAALAELTKIENFHKDLTRTLIALHFNQNIKARLRLKDMWETTEDRLCDEKTGAWCDGCGTSLRTITMFVLDPLAAGTLEWCQPCSIQSFRTMLDELIKSMPED